MPEIKYFPKRRVAFLTSVGPFGQAIPGGLERIFAWASANRVQPLGAPLSNFPDDPSKVPAEKLRSEICIPVGPEVQGSGEVQIKEVGGFEAATMVYRNPQEIEHAYNELYAWLQGQGYHDTGDPVETYLRSGQDFSAEIAVPIAKIETVSAPVQAAAKKAARKRVPARKKTAPKKAAGKKTAAKKGAAKKTAAKRRAKK